MKYFLEDNCEYSIYLILYSSYCKCGNKLNFTILDVIDTVSIFKSVCNECKKIYNLDLSKVVCHIQKDNKKI